MNIYTEDEALIELLEVGCTNDKRYKRLPKDVIKGYIKAYNHLRAAKRIEDLFRIGSLHYERLKGDSGVTMADLGFTEYNFSN